MGGSVSRITGELAVKLTALETRKLREALTRGERFSVKVGKIPKLAIETTSVVEIEKLAYDYDSGSGVLTLYNK